MHTVMHINEAFDSSLYLLLSSKTEKFQILILDLQEILLPVPVAH